MTNNPQYLGGPGPPLRPMVGSITPVPSIPPPMAPQFRPVVPMHPSQQYAPPLQQYPSHNPVIPAMNLGMPQSHTQQMQFAPQIQQAPPRPMPPIQVPPMSQPLPLPNAPLNRPMSSGLPQPVQDLQAQNSFPPATGGLPMQVPQAYAPNAYTASQYQPVSQMNLHRNSVSGPSGMSSGTQSTASLTPSQQAGRPSPSFSIVSASDSQPKPREQSSSDWLEHVKNGRRFYYNKKTRQSTWEKPFELMTPIERADATTDWKEFSSPDGRKYYYNKVSKQSKWTIPDELKLAREQAEKAYSAAEVDGSTQTLISAVNGTPHNVDKSVVNSSPVEMSPVAVPRTPPAKSSPNPTSLPHEDLGAQTNAVEPQSPAETLSTTPAAISGATENNTDSAEAALLPRSSSNSLSAQEEVDPPQNVQLQDAEEANPTTSISGNVNDIAREVKQEKPAYATKKEQRDVFRALLASAKVESDWTWEQAMRSIINDKRYGVLKSLADRKQTFYEFVNVKKKQEAEERRARIKKAKEDFRKMLEECSELTSMTRWGKAVDMFGNDDRFKAIERSRDREDMFDDYLVELEEKERAKAEEDRLRYIMEYRKFLESCDFITGNSQWRKVKDRLEADERCSQLETMDRLKIFQEYVGDLEKEEEEQKRMQKEEIRKAERRNRDEFRKLMDDHISDGTLTAKTLWREYHSKVKDLPAYIAVSSNSSGSTPKELFEDIAEELNKKYQEEKTWIKDAVKSEKVSLSSTWTLEEFKSAISHDISSSAVSESNLKLVLEELLERAREKEEKEAKRRKRLGDEFFNVLCSLKEITGKSEWEDSLPLFQTLEEFRVIGDEAFANQIFEEYLVELREKEKERRRKEEKAKREKERERERRHRDRREKDRRHDRSRGRERSVRDDEDAEPELSEGCVSNESRRLGNDKDKKHHKRHLDEGRETSLDKYEKDHSRSSHRHSSERKKSRHEEDTPESDSDSKHKKQKTEHHNGSRRKGDNEELEDGELGEACIV